MVLPGSFTSSSSSCSFAFFVLYFVVVVGYTIFVVLMNGSMETKSTPTIFLCTGSQKADIKAGCKTIARDENKRMEKTTRSVVRTWMLNSDGSIIWIFKIYLCAFLCAQTERYATTSIYHVCGACVCVKVSGSLKNHDQIRAYISKIYYGDGVREFVCTKAKGFKITIQHFHIEIRGKGERVGRVKMAPQIFLNR